MILQSLRNARGRQQKCPPKVSPTQQIAVPLVRFPVPLALIAEWLGHADPETAFIYASAHADTELKRLALTKATGGIATNPPALFDLARPTRHRPTTLQTHQLIGLSR